MRGPNKVLVQDGATCHWGNTLKPKAELNTKRGRPVRGEVRPSRYVMPETNREWLSKMGVQVLDGWPSDAPNLNPIENIWSLLNPRVAARRDELTSDAALARVMREEFYAIPTREMNTFATSLPSRLQACQQDPAQAGSGRAGGNRVRRGRKDL